MPDKPTHPTPLTCTHCRPKHHIERTATGWVYTATHAPTCPVRDK